MAALVDHCRLPPAFQPPVFQPPVLQPLLGFAPLASQGQPSACAGLEPHCLCCRPPAPVAWSSCPPAGGELLVHGDPAEVGRVSDGEVGLVLQRIFGREGLLALFGRPDAAGAQRLSCGGMNHLFLVAHAGRLAKCTRPRSACLSEAREAERLRREAPALAADAHAVFPLASFLCHEPPLLRTGLPPCEVVVFEHLEGCRSLGDLLRFFERTHPMGALRTTACCVQHRSGQICDHVAPLRSLVAQQAARLNWRFQAMHGRRHGDFKADNILLDRRGMPRLADFLSPFCQSCDREEFLSSTDSSHPVVNEMRGAFSLAWQAEAQHAEALGRSPGCSVSREEAFHNAQLMEALEHLNVARQSQSIFGPMPSLLANIGLSVQALAAPPLGSCQLPRQLREADLRALDGSRREAPMECGSSGSSSRSASGSSGSSAGGCTGRRRSSYIL